jgi:hypothetical protein
MGFFRVQPTDPTNFAHGFQFAPVDGQLLNLYEWKTLPIGVIWTENKQG